MMNLMFILALTISNTVAKTRKDVQIPAKSLGRHKELVNYGYFIAHKKSRLIVTRSKANVVMVHNLKECGIACVNYYSCFSFNVAIRPDSYGHFICELLANSKYINPKDVRSSEGFHHYSIKTPCLNNPCKNGASCIPRYHDDTYTCRCKAGYVGRHCETDYDECVSSPCKNGGTCNDKINYFSCTCASEWGGTRCSYRKDCAALKKYDKKTSGRYAIAPSYTPFTVYCDMVDDGGGWTVIQKRVDGTLNFTKDWSDYANGFGSIWGEHWLGNGYIYSVAYLGSTALRVDIEDWSGNKAYAKYGTFKVAPYYYKYRLTVGSYSGTAGDSLSYHNGRQFSTFDNDNDLNCASQYESGWWFKSCLQSNLNGRYLDNEEGKNGTVWYSWKSNWLSMKKTTMKIRRLL